MSITAKVVCNEAKKSIEHTVLSFCADYKDGRNKEWAAYTPSLQFTMTVKNEVADQFAPGQSFTVTFEPES